MMITRKKHFQGWGNKSTIALLRLFRSQKLRLVKLLAGNLNGIG